MCYSLPLLCGHRFANSCRMAKSPENVQQFLQDLATRLIPKAKQELEVLLAMKRNDINAKVDGTQPDRLFHWDLPFYHEQLLKQHNVDSNDGKWPLCSLIHLSLHYTLHSRQLFPYPDRRSSNVRHFPGLVRANGRRVHGFRKRIASRNWQRLGLCLALRC